MAGSAAIGNLAVNLTLETAAFQRGAAVAEKRVESMRGRFSAATKSVAGFGLAIGAGFGVAALTGLAKGAFSMAAALSESAQQMGVTVEALQELNFAAEQSGISQDQLATAMARLNKSTGSLLQGSKQAEAAFARIGLAADDLSGKSPDQALRLIADALNKLPTVQERVSAGQAIMGRSFSQLLPLINGGSAALDKYAQASQKMGQVSTADAKKLDEFSDSWEKLRTRILVTTAGVLAGAIRLDESVQKWWAFRDKVTQAVVQMHASVINSVNNMVDGIASAISNRLSAIWEGAKAKIQSVKNAFRAMAEAVSLHSYVPDMVDGIAQSMARLQEIMVDPALSATQKVGSAFQNLAGLVGGLFGQKTGGFLSAIGGLVSALAPLFGGSFNSAAFASTVASNNAALGVNLPGAARGASGVFGGRSGIDKNLLSLNGSPIARVSRGERFSISPNASMAKVLIVPTPYFDAHVKGQAVEVAAPMAGHAAIAGASGGMAGMQRRAMRTIP